MNTIKCNTKDDVAANVFGKDTEVIYFIKRENVNICFSRTDLEHYFDVLV